MLLRAKGKMNGILCIALMLVIALAAHGQAPGSQEPPPPRPESGAEGFISRMMVFDDNRDGKIARTEVTDPRLLDLFDRADSNHDGVVTKEELKALYLKESAGFRGRPRGGLGGPGSRFREFGGPPEFGGPGGPERMFEPGQILSDMMQRVLALTPQQKAALTEIQRDVDARMDKLLTPEQKAKLKEIEQHGPGGPKRGFDGRR